jgi:(1->4)-alpha-D-glucan 1-alpha-D-glucosylmutase
VFDFVGSVLTTDLAASRPPAQRDAIIEFAMKLQQFSAPVMAKGMEDTAFYLYNRLASLNEVGGEPRSFDVSVARFHDANAERAWFWPHALLATSTHDSKRSEDVRARIDALSELPAEWRLHASRWRRFNRTRRHMVDQVEAPSRNDEYLLYQTLVGAWPGGEVGAPALESFRERIERYLIKVVREAKAFSSWLNPNEQYEAALIGMARAMLAPGNKRFFEDFVPFQRRIAWFGMLNSLAQTLLKLAAPGVPDIYQGCERWNLSLVDPDNRRPIDHAADAKSLRAMQSAVAMGEGALAALARELMQAMHDGRIKQFVTWRALALRREREALFRNGAYLPLEISGEHADHLCAFARVQDGQRVIAVATRLACTLMNGETAIPAGPEVWGDTRILLGDASSHLTWQDALTGEIVRTDDRAPRTLAASEALAILPVALLVAKHR